MPYWMFWNSLVGNKDIYYLKNMYTTVPKFGVTLVMTLFQKQI